jgi:hypothetical protein
MHIFNPKRKQQDHPLKASKSQIKMNTLKTNQFTTQMINQLCYLPYTIFTLYHAIHIKLHVDITQPCYLYYAYIAAETYSLAQIRIVHLDSSIL